MAEPLDPAGDGGRDSQGRFSPGNHAGRGNPHAKRVAQLRAALLSAVKPADVKAVATKLLEKAKAGDTAAIRELLDRTIGRPTEADLIERLEAAEAALEEIRKGQTDDRLQEAP